MGERIRNQLGNEFTPAEKNSLTNIRIRFSSLRQDDLGPLDMRRLEFAR